METKEQFYEAAEKEFGDNIKIDVIPITDEAKAKYGIEQKDIDEYGKHAWIVGDRCPKCGTRLFGLSGSFSWGIQHGVGNCSNCGIALRLYHYIKTKNGETRVERLSVVGF